ncbi:30S ribosomal protein S20 [Candidatus Parcubacteria bacterium]|nr:30S ribosomal protein S20 [Patescibacteria group bacterium]MBU4309899.1 30S ribosomal protein S20 [Patescibacteria group bacterium]MBU4431907.1 30S ribosomal protein S20 [Patescibacteria group bacterium]MBU4578238.1 30S ribosomal protein S20 [Patescibacteria group bacterium]MCG2696774.1 30S ribosomal protein S20 [Candidatus Parcubacteria bacterium]
MPNLKSAIKELRKSKSRGHRNQLVKDDLKTQIKKTRKLIVGKDKTVEEVVKATLKTIDKAAQKGVIKKNARDRKKSRLQLMLNASKKTK